MAIIAFFRATGRKKNLAFCVESCVTGSGAVESEKERIRIDDIVERWGPRVPETAHMVRGDGDNDGCDLKGESLGFVSVSDS